MIPGGTPLASTSASGGGKASKEQDSQLIKDTAGTTHALSCGVPDCHSNETRYLKEAADMIEDFQRRGSRRKATEITLVECQKISSLLRTRSEACGTSLEEDEETKNIRADEVKWTDHGPVVQFCLFRPCQFVLFDWQTLAGWPRRMVPRLISSH